MIPALLVRADANSRIGSGHVMRCLALAQAWRRKGGSVTFAMTPGAGPLEQRLDSEGFSRAVIDATPGSNEDLEQTVAAAHAANARHLVVDGYEFGAEYRSGLAGSDRTLLTVDDCADLGPYSGALVLNQNLAAQAEMYEQGSALPRLLLGSRYVLLREEFLIEDTAQVPNVATNLLVTLGGSDPEGITGTVVESLQHVPTHLQVTIVLGAHNAQRGALEAAAASLPHQVEFLENVTAMAPLLLSAHLVVTAGGATCWEICRLGLPAIVTTAAANQEPNSLALGKIGAMHDAGWYHQLSPPELGARIQALVVESNARRTMQERQQNLIDGQGADRVVAALLEVGPR